MEVLNLLEHTRVVDMRCASGNESAFMTLGDDEPLETVLADLAVAALLDEASLTPKPALVDKRGRGAHHDLNLELMLQSAHGLRASFAKMAGCAKGRKPDSLVRAELGRIGREAEAVMFSTTKGINTHRGAIWSLGLLVAGAAVCGSLSAEEITDTAAVIARIPDRHVSAQAGNGVTVQRQFGVNGARGEAATGFPHVIGIGLPALRSSRARNVSEQGAQLDTLMAIMASLDDTCLLHRGGRGALNAAKEGARAVLAEGGFSNPKGRKALDDLDRILLSYWASPGGSADLLAATLFVDKCCRAQDTVRINSSGSVYGFGEL